MNSRNVEKKKMFRTNIKIAKREEMKKAHSKAKCNDVRIESVCEQNTSAIIQKMNSMVTTSEARIN